MAGGVATLRGVRAGKGDQLHVRHNLCALGYVALVGSRIALLGLDRDYRLPTPSSGRGISPQASGLSPRGACDGGCRERLGGGNAVVGGDSPPKAYRAPGAMQGRTAAPSAIRQMTRGAIPRRSSLPTSRREGPRPVPGEGHSSPAHIRETWMAM